MSSYEVDQHSLGYADQWHKMRESQPRKSDIWSVAESPVASQDLDCEYEEDQSRIDENDSRIDDSRRNAAEDESWPSGIHCGNGTAQDGSSELPGIFGTVYTDLDERVQGLEEQFRKQNEWNENMQQGMETVAQRYEEISALQETVAILQAKVNELCGGKNGTVERKPGRPRRLPQ